MRSRSFLKKKEKGNTGDVPIKGTAVPIPACLLGSAIKNILIINLLAVPCNAFNFPEGSNWYPKNVPGLSRGIL